MEKEGQGVDCGVEGRAGTDWLLFTNTYRDKLFNIAILRTKGAHEK